jgi:hypothetical protein
LFILTANGFLPGGSGTTIKHNTQITLHTQTEHSTQNYRNNKGHTTHNEYNITGGILKESSKKNPAYALCEDSIPSEVSK